MQRGGVSVRERLGCAEEEEVVGGRGGDCAPIHIGGIWLENELCLFLEGVREVFLRRVGQKLSQNIQENRNIVTV